MKLQKRLSSKILKCSPKRIKFNQEKLKEIKEAITKFDIMKQIKKGAITSIHKKGNSRAKAKEQKLKKQKGQRRGHGSRKGKINARLNQKKQWINKIRLQRKFLKKIKALKKINQKDYNTTYYKATGGFFRSLNHLKGYLNEKGIIK